MARAARGGYGDDSVYFDAFKQRWTGAVSLGYTPDGKRRVRRKVTGKTGMKCSGSGKEWRAPRGWVMRWLGWMCPVLAAAAAVIMGPGSAAAAATYQDSISGYEYAATSTRGSFAGAAPGALPGAWSATVDHTPLATVATITGGKVYLATYQNGVPTLVTADFTGGTVRQLSGFTGCASQQYAVNGRLGEVGFGSAGAGTGAFAGTLTHYRAKIFGHCVIYSATITGSLTVTPS